MLAVYQDDILRVSVRNTSKHKGRAMTNQVSVFLNGNLLHANRDGSFEFVSFGLPTGFVGKTQCFESVTIRDTRGCNHKITGSTYGGPVSIIIRTGKSRKWYGIGDAVTVAKRSLEKAQA